MACEKCKNKTIERKWKRFPNVSKKNIKKDNKK